MDEYRKGFGSRQQSQPQVSVGSSRFKQYLNSVFGNNSLGTQSYQSTKASAYVRPNSSCAVASNCSVASSMDSLPSPPSSTVASVPPKTAPAMKSPYEATAIAPAAASKAHGKLNKKQQKIEERKAALCSSHMPLGFGSHKAPLRQSYFTTSDPTSKYFKPLKALPDAAVTEQIVRRNGNEKTLQDLTLDQFASKAFDYSNGTGQRHSSEFQKLIRPCDDFGSTQALMKGHIKFGDDKLTTLYETATQAQYDRKDLSFCKQEPVSSLTELMRGTMTLGKDKPTYLTTSGEHFNTKKLESSEPLRDTRSMQSTSIVFGTHRNVFETTAQAQYNTKVLSKREPISSTQELMRSRMVLGTEKNDYVTMHRALFDDKTHLLEKAELMGSKQALNSSHMVLGTEPPKFESVTRSEYIAHKLDDDDE